MSEIAIQVEQLSKKYIIGHQRDARDGLRHALEDAFRSPLRWFRQRQVARARLSEDFWALKDVSFNVPQGEVVGIIGRNGAGKSTLLKVLSRITEPTSGSVRIRGRVASLLEVGTGFHQELTGRENIFLNGAILGMSKAEIKRKFDEIVAFSEVEKFLDTPVKRYSSGMYVRLAFAVAAHLEPEILIVDEVLAVGDAEFQKKCLGKMGEVSKTGRTVLFVSHNMAATRALCSTAIWMEKGSVKEVGRVGPVSDRYLARLHENPSLDVDLTARPRAAHFGSKLKITRVRFNQGRGLWHGQPLEVEIAFECSASVDDVSFGVGFCNRDGPPVLCLDTDLPGERWAVTAGQSGCARLRIPSLHLEPHHYSLYVGARSGDGHILDYLPDLGQALVAPSDTTPTMIAGPECGRGGVRQPADSSVELGVTAGQSNHWLRETKLLKSA